jgi:hypothetical protein
VILSNAQSSANMNGALVLATIVLPASALFAETPKLNIYRGNPTLREDAEA